MTWAERVGDLATTVVLVFINFIRLFTIPLRLAAQAVDGLVVNLAELSERGIRPAAEVPVLTGWRSWVQAFASVLLGIAWIILRLVSIVTVFVRQLTATVDDFFRALAEAPAPPAAPPAAPTG